MEIVDLYKIVSDDFLILEFNSLVCGLKEEYWKLSLSSSSNTANNYHLKGKIKTFIFE